MGRWARALGMALAVYLMLVAVIAVCALVQPWPSGQDAEGELSDTALVTKLLEEREERKLERFLGQARS
jgi:hypothetical protein